MVIFGLLSSLIGLYPLLYLLIDRRFGLLSSKTDVVLGNLTWNVFFYAHILLGGLALLIGWTQFLAKLRAKRPLLHRNIGKVYVSAVLLSAVSGIYIGYFATGGLVSAVGFISLGVFWFGFTLRAYQAARSGDFLLHKKSMYFSYAACFAAVTLRIWLPLLVISVGDFVPAYRIVAWLCWVPNLFVAYFLTRNLRLSEA